MADELNWLGTLASAESILEKGNRFAPIFSTSNETLVQQGLYYFSPPESRTFYIRPTIYKYQKHLFELTKG